MTIITPIQTGTEPATDQAVLFITIPPEIKHITSVNYKFHLVNAFTTILIELFISYFSNTEKIIRPVTGKIHPAIDKLDNMVLYLCFRKVITLINKRK